MAIPEPGYKTILWLSHLLPWPPKGGVLQRSYYLLRAVGQRHRLHLISFHQKAHQETEEKKAEAVEALSDFAEVHGVFPLPKDVRTGGVVRLAVESLFPGAPYTIRWGWSREFAESVERTVRRVNPDLVFFDTVSLANYLSGTKGTARVLNHHNVESQMLFRRARNEKNPLERFYYWQEAMRLADFEKRIASQFSAHIVCSELDAQRLNSVIGPVPTHIVPNGVDLEYFFPAPATLSQKPETLIFVGRMSWYPNISAIRFFIEEVWPRLQAIRPDASFRVVGADPPADLIKLAKPYPRIQFLGFVDEMRPLVQESSVYICPIFDGGGTKLKMLDAMAMGKAIVAHSVACEGLSLTDGQNVFVANSGEEFLNHILRLFDDHELRLRLGAAARRHVEKHFSFEEIGESLSGILQRVV